MRLCIIKMPHRKRGRETMLSARFGCLISVFFALVAVGIFACGLVVCLVLLGIAVITVAVYAVGIFVGAFVGSVASGVIGIVVL